ncbi:MAG: hypothetical protein AB7E95_12950 [Kiritimatiellales bacterium]
MYSRYALPLAAALLLSAGSALADDAPKNKHAEMKAQAEARMESAKKEKADQTKAMEKQREKKAEQIRKEADKGSEKGQAMREEHSRKWWKFWGSDDQNTK